MEMPAVLESANLPSEGSHNQEEHTEAEDNGDSFCTQEGDEQCPRENAKQEEGADDVGEVSAQKDGIDNLGNVDPVPQENTRVELNVDSSSGAACSPGSAHEQTKELSSNASLPVNQDLEALPHRTEPASSSPDIRDEAKAEGGEGTLPTERADQGNDTDGAKEEGAPEDDNGRGKQGPKRVTFPSDDDIVSGALEPKDPWRHAQNVTVEDVIASYTQACQKLNCKQSPKLIRQLQDLTDLSGRVDNLDLKGEKLDHKACEALEEIFKRVQFKMVDLEQTNLDEDGASALFDMIEYYESATHLNISFNKHIGTRGWQAAAHMMRKTNCLQYLDARNTPLLDHSAPFVARALRISSSLTVLHLENTSLSGRPLMLLATALKMNIVLRELYLADNRLNSLQDSAQLGNVLKFNSCIQILDLRNNHIMDSGLAYICEGLKEQRQGLVTLVLWNNQLTHAGMVYMSMCLPHTQTLETLNLGHNAIGNEGVRHLKNGLIGNRSVLRLGLACAKLTCEGAVAVAEFVAESPRLLRLDLRENEIKTGGLMALSLALRVNQSLLRMDLDREPKKETVKSFIETQKALLTEIQNGCRRNFVLAKEKEERLQHSASMAEIASAAEEEDTSTAPEEISHATEDSNTANENSKPHSDDQEEEEITPAPDPQGQDSDSDTEDEEEVIEATEKTAEPPVQSSPAPVAVSSPAPVAVSSPAPVAVSSPAPVAVSSPAPVAVSSPGRGHKVFLVTRVENPNTVDGGKGVPENRESSGTGVAAPASPALANGLQAEFERAPTCCDNKGSHGSYCDTELEDLLREASTEPDPSLNVIAL
ncbi:protein phosphatase 1 regulatory subunit 37 [Hyla sarda]|uniref:protein phosphatase 1 regulatory subunit 37 n=1 Tax=Hyla sarda TaxID=327740 RepID=UPI0024C3A198|nr:protein phosphatase 1 regulatory subunit 37 [Hyla sarda]XP_056395207.1 protein phosphatase 1 regulatory subunit 37 [Hyla sarda]